MSISHHTQRRADMDLISKDLKWMKTEYDVKVEATIVKEKLHAVREKYRTANYSEIKGSNKSFIEWNEDLLSFCKANRRKYSLESRTEKIDRQILEFQMIIAQKEEEVEKLRKDLREAKDGKENALNRLSELQSHLLKVGNPDIADLGDKNRPTNLGEKYRELYDNEWTDVFEFLTEKNDKKDSEAIDILHAMLKSCSDYCSEYVVRQHKALAAMVTDPLSVKIITSGKSSDQTGIGNKDSTNSAHVQAVYDVEHSPDATKLETGNRAVTGKADVAIKEFCKAVADDLLKNIEITDIIPALVKDQQFNEDILQNNEVKTYLEKSFKLFWLMQTHHPPMFVDFTKSAGESFDTNAFESYTNRGPEIEQIVWPPVYLHENGPIVTKGVAQGTNQ